MKFDQSDGQTRLNLIRYDKTHKKLIQDHLFLICQKAGVLGEATMVFPLHSQEMKVSGLRESCELYLRVL
jgi:hypothetical protein